MLILCYFSKPLTIRVEKPKSSLGQKNIFEVLKQSLNNTSDRTTKDHGVIRNLRETASQSIKVYEQFLNRVSE